MGSCQCLTLFIFILRVLLQSLSVSHHTKIEPWTAETFMSLLRYQYFMSILLQGVEEEEKGIM
jgi:hypothetical protein